MDHCSCNLATINLFFNQNIQNSLEFVVEITMPTVKIESKIDSGGFGEVFRATIVEDGRKVAAKRLAKPYSYEDAKRFNREVRIMESLDHPNIIRVLFSNLETDPPIFIMPLAEGNLLEILPDLRQNEERRIFIFQQILAGMQYAHESGVIHRDLKPQNILVFESGRIQIADFGSGRFISRDLTTLTMQGDQLGTLFYSSPEQLSDFSAADIRSDIYTLGKILYQMLTSRPVFPVLNFTGLEGRYVYMIQKCIDDDPEKRYQSVKELSDDFFLLTQKEFNVESPTSIAQKLIVEIVDPFNETADSTGTEALIKLFLEYTENEDLYINILPNLPIEILRKIITLNLYSFLTIIQTYDIFVSVNLPFSYCDTAANFYYRVFYMLENFPIKKMILQRLLAMGYSHNRWHVRDVLAAIVQDTKDIGLARLALDAFRVDTEATKWSLAAIDTEKLHPLLRDGIHQLITEVEDDNEIPF